MNPPAAVVNTFWWGVNLAFEVPLDRLPVALVERPSRIFAGLIAGFGGSLVAIGIGVGFMLFGEGELSAGAVAGLGVFLLCSIPILLAGINLFVKRKAITLDRDAVQWDARTLFGRTSREEPMRAFAGVLVRTFIVRGEGGGQVLDALELAHADAANVVRVFKAKTGRLIVGPWAAYCRCFALPAIEDVTPQFRITRDLVDLETPLVELVKHGRVVLPVVAASPPASIEAHVADRQLTLRLSDDRTLVVTPSGLTDVSAKRSRRVGIAAKIHGLDGAADGGRLYPRADIDAFTVEESFVKRKPCVVMKVRHRVEASDGPRVEGRRVELHVDDDLDTCIWLQATLLRAVALRVGDARGAQPR